MMRSNGLPAARFDVLQDVDQLVSARLLQLLAEAGIAAYARQRANAVDPTRFDVVDRLWVDASRRDEAASLVDAHLPEISALLERDDDATFAAIIAGWDNEQDPVGAWPVQEDLDGDSDGGDDAATTTRRRLVRPAATEAPRGVDDVLDDHFVPLPPPPLPRLPKQTVLALAALLAGASTFIVVWLFGLTVDPPVQWLAVVALFGGATALVARMRDKLPPQESGPDDGAVL